MLVGGAKIQRKVVVLTAVLLLVLVVAFFVLALPNPVDPSDADINKEPFYFGVCYCGDTVEDAKLLIDRVKNFTNLLVIGSGSLQNTPAKLGEICDYAVSSGLKLIVYFSVNNNSDVVDWFETATHRWNDNLLGIYYGDEPGGKHLDGAPRDLMKHILERYSDLTMDEVANGFIENHQNELRVFENQSVIVFTSDYALHWFDYQAGYDVIFAELGWNNTVVQEIGLVRGAANLQNKSWGTIITWTYNNPPYLADGDTIFEQMLQSYESGAEYVVIFNYDQDLGDHYGTLREEHFVAMEQFWCDVVQNPDIVHGGDSAEVVLVLPKNYGWGMRTPHDVIWGYWDPDDVSDQIWNTLQYCLSEYGTKLDIVYDDTMFPVDGKYLQVCFWNQTT
jgi:hypothetical protein